MDLVFIVAQVVGALMSCAVIWVYVRSRAFGLAGSFLTVFSVILLGMPVWNSVTVSIGNVNLELLKTINNNVKTINNNVKTLKDDVKQIDSSFKAVEKRSEKFDTFVGQLELQNRKLYDGTPNGLLDQKTKESILKFQEDKKLPQTGILDESTKRALGIQLSP